ncbi:MAG: tRNA guanosine(34) transglycosylase Tgt [Anaerolineales bacterium]|nr:MAG: tRNA guanosine(34) transglycosylase Tgt [Anaerolineales bacterium]
MDSGQSLTLAHGDLHFPVFLPDGTRGVVRAVDSNDIESAGIQAVVMNVFHLMQRPGSSTIQALGGLHQMSGWQRPIVTDSGGFQAYSVIRQEPKKGSLSNKGITFRREGSKRRYHLTPEKSINLQINYGADVVICLDDCTHVDDDLETQQKAVERTIAWARRCRAEFDRLVNLKGMGSEILPKLFAVVQGGGSRELRRQCAEQLLRTGFDGYGYGGWPLDGEGNLLVEMLSYTRELIPAEFPLHALGVGHPENVVACAKMGYQMFDSALPTRDARRGRLFTFTAETGLTGNWFRFLYINDEKHIRSQQPISEFCDCHTCTKFSRGYLHHLFKINDHLFFRLATLHNLRFMRRLEDRLRAQHDG